MNWGSLESGDTGQSLAGPYLMLLYFPATDEMSLKGKEAFARGGIGGVRVGGDWFPDLSRACPWFESKNHVMWQRRTDLPSQSIGSNPEASSNRQ